MKPVAIARIAKIQKPVCTNNLVIELPVRRTYHADHRPTDSRTRWYVLPARIPAGIAQLAASENGSTTR